MHCEACTSRRSSTLNVKRHNGCWTPCPQGGGKFELTEDDAHAWAAAVNDVRLALGTMLDIGPNGPERLPPTIPWPGIWTCISG